MVHTGVGLQVFYFILHAVLPDRCTMGCVDGLEEAHYCNGVGPRRCGPLFPLPAVEPHIVEAAAEEESGLALRAGQPGW